MNDINEGSSYKVFISYRRQDSQATSDRIYESLLNYFSRDEIFMDTDTIPPGYSFPGYIEYVLRQCRVALIVIGPSWSSVTETSGEYAGQRRLDDPGDHVRIEVERALELGQVDSAGRPTGNLLLIPLLVQNAHMPRANDLPESLRELAKRNASPIRPNPDFKRDLSRLMAHVTGWMGRPNPERLENSMSSSAPFALRLENIMLEEFKYASSTATQALDDRGRMYGLYLGIAAVLAGGVGALATFSKLDSQTEVIISALLLLLGFIGILFFFQIVRINQAFSESLLTMNVIKENYIEQFRETVPGIERVFRWRVRTIPSGRRFGSMTFLMCMTIILTDSLALGMAAIAFTELVTNDTTVDIIHLSTNPIVYGISGAVYLLASLLQFVAYEFMLRRRSDEELETAKQNIERSYALEE